MRITNSTKLLIVLIIALSSHLGYSQLSKTHYIPPLTSAEFGNANPETQYIYISTPSNTDVAYTIKQIGLPATSDITGTVSNTNPSAVYLGTGNGQLFVPSTQTSIITHKGYVIEAGDVIYVSVRMEAGGSSQAGALVSKGTSALGTQFRVGSYTNENAGTNYLNFVSVMATEDNTQVNFSDLPVGLSIKNYSGTTPINVNLNKNESYIIATNASENTINRDGLIGTLVSSDKNIVVNCGSTNGSFHNGAGRDYGIDQIAGASKIGKEYIFVKGDGTNDWENVLIVGHTDNTSISINGNTPVATINAGDYYLIEGNNYNIGGNMFVETSEDVFAYQGVGATTSEANQGMFFVPPLSCEARGNLDNIANIEDIGSTNYSGGVSIVTKVGATVTINNLPIINFSPAGPNIVDGNADYVTYKVTGLAGNISVQSSDELYCAYFNFNGAATSGSFYSGFPSAPEINFDATFSTLGNCIPNITLEATNTQNFDTYQWYFDDGSGLGFVGLSSNTPNYTPTQPGTYKLIGVVTCSGLVLESAGVPVSICPDDIDNDGVIDNLDIDNDNDGILNCTESKGDVTINLSDVNDPELVFQDNSRTYALIDGAHTSATSNSVNTNIFDGNASGGISSIIPSTSSGENTYNVSFTEPVNLKFEEGISNLYPISTASYVVSISPSNKNITLLDPDDKLLIDSNFDGVYETGVTQISSSEIRFKVNPAPNGNEPFQFLADQITVFSFVHKVLTSTSDSSFFGALSLTCFKNDYDLDGIKDALDLDSDNDGIPDYVESLGNNHLALSGIDTDANGLDDIYDITAIPIDTDNDSIKDYLDLDSDNDGIYDLIESGGHGTHLSDTDVNGIIDWMGPTDLNGLVDSAETGPDSGIIAYTLNDLDNDGNYSYLDLDSDGDGCSDVIEAGYSDGNNDDLLGDITVTVDNFGLVNNASDGYGIPHSDYLTIAPLTIATQPVNTEVCEASDTVISIISADAETFQWELSTDGVNWGTLTDNTTYTGTTTGDLNIASTPLTFNNYQYRVRLDRTGNSCGLYSEEITLVVNPLPIINSSVILIQCDDDIDGVSDINLTEVNDEISTNAANETFTYFTSQAAALIGDITDPDYITDPTIYNNASSPFTDTVWARVSSLFGCASVSEIQLTVSATVIPSTFQQTFSNCDDFLDINGNDNVNNDDRDGVASFDFGNVRTLVENMFLPQTPNINFYRNQAEALAEINPIADISNYRNIGYPNTQQVYIRVDSQLGNDCLGLGAHITLNVESLPIANPVSINRECDIDASDTVLNFPFDSSQIETTVLGTQTLADVSVAYFDQNSNPLPSPLPNPFLTESQTITIRVTNNLTADPNGPCYDETTLEFIVDEQPIVAGTIPPQIVCDGDVGDIDDDNIYPFDTSTFTNTILGAQTGMEIYFDYIDENGNPVIDSPTLPNPLNSGNQTIDVEILNPNNPNCTVNTTIDFIVNPLPEFYFDPVPPVCTSDPTFTIVLDPEEVNTTEAFTYQWHWTSIDNSIVNQLLPDTTPTLTVSSPGTYYVTLTKTDGTGCSRTRDVFVNASELATVTLDDVTIVDFSDNNTITIDNSTLGQGDYEFALEGDINYPYRDEPYFENVAPGIYTLLINDKNGCGTTPLQISVIGYPKFFTPNGDGINETWQIKGISSLFQPNSTIYIFDRYGKLLKQLNPLGEGWNGTFNGNTLPTSDYWFKVLLQDGRVFNGHFTLKR